MPHHHFKSGQKYCPFHVRLMVMVYDGLILCGLLVIAAAVALPVGDPEKVAFRDPWFTAWLAFVCFGYLGACWHYAGMTLGMRAWRARLVKAGGGAISWPACLLRFIVGVVSLGALGIGVAWALVDDKNRSWHDLASGTLLVRIDKNARKR